MKQFASSKELFEELKKLKKNAQSIGFVPTMGALHSGHIELIKQAKKQTTHVVVSIFVNPTQFNDPADFQAYPRTIQEDIKLLEQQNVDYLFVPTTQEIYPQSQEQELIDLGKLDKEMEGRFRPNHFQGVAQVVKRLLAIIQPDYAFFGQKDFQQLTIIRHLVKHEKLSVKIIACPTVRNDQGLALSSRNMRLSEAQKQQATAIYQTLLYAQQYADKISPKELKKRCIDRLEKEELKVDYFEFVHPDTLSFLEEQWESDAIACVALYCGNVRLIDNMHITTTK